MHQNNIKKLKIFLVFIIFFFFLLFGGVGGGGGGGGGVKAITEMDKRRRGIHLLEILKQEIFYQSYKVQLSVLHVIVLLLRK